MEELIAKANQAILESQWLRWETRSLRIEAARLASELGTTILRAKKELSGDSTMTDQSLFAWDF